MPTPQGRDARATLTAFLSVRVDAWSAQALQNVVEIEAARLLPRRVFFERGQELRHEGLGRYEQKHAIDSPVRIIDPIVVGLLEGIAPQVEELGNAQGDERVLPHVKGMAPLFGKDHFPAVVA